MRFVSDWKNVLVFDRSADVELSDRSCRRDEGEAQVFPGGRSVVGSNADILVERDTGFAVERLCDR